MFRCGFRCADTKCCQLPSLLETLCKHSAAFSPNEVIVVFVITFRCWSQRPFRTIFITFRCWSQGPFRRVFVTFAAGASVFSWQFSLTFAAEASVLSGQFLSPFIGGNSDISEKAYLPFPVWDHLYFRRVFITCFACWNENPRREVSLISQCSKTDIFSGLFPLFFAVWNHCL